MDTNRQYSERIFSSVERIVIDTSALMDDGFLAFIQNDREILCDGQKKIVVPVEVYAELTRHLLSNDNKKCSEAQRAVEIIKQNRDIFDVEAKRLTDEDLSYAFADRQILSELTLHKSDYNQLLISNDKGLTSDAFDLNQLKSYKGEFSFAISTAMAKCINVNAFAANKTNITDLKRILPLLRNHTNNLKSQNLLAKPCQ